MDKKFYFYILASKKNGTLYKGITSELVQRIWKHKTKYYEGFTNKYNVDKLVYYEVYENAEGAIKREKLVRYWKRQWKLDLINKFNPDWKDLYEEISK